MVEPKLTEASAMVTGVSRRDAVLVGWVDLDVPQSGIVLQEVGLNKIELRWEDVYACAAWQ
jgi:hypothetical protein